jgi:hypothetical protein
MILGNNKDKFGFYQVGDRRTYSKLEAIELHRQTGIHPHWNFNEEFFSSYDWTVEPSEDLETLYARRAQQIRDTYDYVVVAYSGGVDSDNIIKSFVNNNIKLDEILTYNVYKSHNNYKHVDTHELVQKAWPTIKSLKDQGIDFKHRHLDLSDQVFQILQDTNMRLNRAYYASTHFGSIHLSATYLRETEPDYIKLSESNKKMVFVWGTDKPRIYYENEKFCLKFLDLVDNGVRVRTQMLNRQNEYDELFYWSPESVDIICKQGHILKNFFKQCHSFISSDDGFNSNLLSNNVGPIKSYVNEHRGQLSLPDELSYLREFSPMDLTNWLIYRDFDPGSWFTFKPKTRLISPRESVFNQDLELNTHVRYLTEKLSSIDRYWWQNPDTIVGGMKLCVSPSYFLE